MRTPKKEKDNENDLIFTFWSKKKEGNELSNFYKCNVVINNRIYNSGESAFHGCKFTILSKFSTNPTRRKELREYGQKFEIDGSVTLVHIK